jgi:hypothetical protein
MTEAILQLVEVHYRLASCSGEDSIGSLDRRQARAYAAAP